MKIGIDLLWVRVGIVGGTESFIRNLLDGFGTYDTENEYILFTARDNGESFRCYESLPNMHLAVMPIDCANQIKRILWENIHLDHIAAEYNVDVMFIPVYSKPRSKKGRIPYVCAILDLQALHYPDYFSRIRRTFLRYAWKHTCRTADKVITISNYCKDDLCRHYPNVKDKIQTIYVPITSTPPHTTPPTISSPTPPTTSPTTSPATPHTTPHTTPLTTSPTTPSTTPPTTPTTPALAKATPTTPLQKYQVEQGGYFYCVSSLLPHKNLATLLAGLDLWYQRTDTRIPLLISGVGDQVQTGRALAATYHIADKVIFTGYVTNEERDFLYENCRLFLFPSIFEGFGMPPIEAMSKGKVTVMTRETCLEEVTEGRAIYVDHPLDPEDWADKIQIAMDTHEKVISFPAYALERIVEQYVEAFKRSLEE